MSKCNVWNALEALHRKLLKLISPQKSSFTLSSKEIAMLYSVHLGIFTIMSNHLVSSFFSPEILKKNEVWSCNHDTKASQNCPKGFTRYLKSVDLQYNTLGCLDDGTNKSSTKRLMFQVLFLFMISCKILCKILFNLFSYFFCKIAKLK